MTVGKQKNVGNFIEWLNSSNIEKKKLFNKIPQQFLTESKENQKILDIVIRRKSNKTFGIKRRKQELLSIPKINKEESKKITAYIASNKCAEKWINARTALNHLWYVLHKKYGISPDKIRELLKKKRHQTNAQAISQIKKNEDKNKYALELMN